MGGGRPGSPARALAVSGGGVWRCLGHLLPFGMSHLGKAFIARIDAMETVTLNNGVEMPALGLGVFQTPPDETRDAVRAALGSGYRLIDTAAAHGNERQVGEAVHDSHLSRSEVFLETKIWISDYGYDEGYDETLHGFEKS